MPQLGETVTEGTVSQWLKREGERVEKYEAFVEVSTDKVNADVPSPVSGTLAKIIAPAGETVAVGAPIATILEDSRPGRDDAPAAVASNGAAHRAGDDAAPAGEAARVSPAVRRLARERGIDLATVAGTGTGGRVTADDVVAAAERTPARTRTVAPPAALGTTLPGTLVGLSPMRRLIARRMVESVTTAPHAWTTVEVDVTALRTWREREKDAFRKRHGAPLTLLHFFIFAAARELRRHPLLNATFRDDGIALHDEIDVGVAVGFDDTLVVPVIRGAQRLSIGALARAAGALVERARRGTLDADDLAGGTFTVNNTGANGSILSAPILHGGQSAIVTMEAVVKRPVVTRDDAIAIRSMMNVCLSIDHRVLDGTSANGFLRDLKTRLEAMGPAGELES